LFYTLKAWTLTTSYTNMIRWPYSGEQKTSFSLTEDLAAVARSSALPAVLLLQTQAQVDELQRLLYGHLPEGVHLQAQSSAGGTNKLVRNFGIHREVILLATAKTLLRLSEAHAGTHLPAATLVVASLPFE
jgi:hypothetical protein